MDGAIAKTVYVENKATAAMRGLPRFGHSRNFADFFGTEAQTVDYLWGLIFAGMFLFAIFVAWSVLLVVFKCVGKKGVGFLSGAPFEKSTTKNRRCCNNSRWCNRPLISRIVFVVATVLFIVFSVLFVTEGLTNLKSTVTTLVDSARDVDQTMTNVTSIIDNIKSIAIATVLSRDLLLSAFQDGGTQCLKDGDAGATLGLDDLINNITTILEELGNFTFGRTEDFASSMERITEGADDVYDTTENIQLGDWQSLIVLIPYILIPVLLVGGVALAWLNIDIPMIRSLLSWLILPIFIIEVVFAYILSSGILIAASGNADFCSGGEQHVPDATVIQIIENLGYDTNDLVFQIVAFYIDQCVTDDPFKLINTYKDELTAAFDYVTSFANLKVQGLGEICISNITAMDTLAGRLNTSIHSLADSADEALDLLQCSNIVQLYTNPVYDGTCTYSITGATWAFAAFAVVACMGLIMIMLRSAWQLDVDAPPDEFDEGAGAYDEGKGVIDEENIDEDNTHVCIPPSDLYEENVEGNEEELGEYAPYDPNSGDEQPMAIASQEVNHDDLHMPEIGMVSAELQVDGHGVTDNTDTIPTRSSILSPIATVT